VFEPAYLKLPPGELERRAETAVASLASCRSCPRDCEIDRLSNISSACKTGRYALVSSYFTHRGEEPCLRGWRGSGTIFFAQCNLRCVFCQNYDISQALKPSAAPGSPPETIAAMMIELQDAGCHNINLVTPEHVVPQILESLAIAVESGLRLPIVYNTSAYDSLESLSLMDGIVDIYMPDFKFWSAESAKRYLKAEEYPEAARAAIIEMHRQVGALELDEHGIARRGVLLRHLVMPGGLTETKEILAWVSKTLGSDAYVNIMAQYYPAGNVSTQRFPEINRHLSTAEFREAVDCARSLGLHRTDTG